jgi:hypothetical protein
MPKLQARQLIKQVPGLGATQINYGAQTATVVGEGWEVLTDGFPLRFVWRGYIDLAGYTQHDLTLFTQQVDIQRNGLIAGNQDVVAGVVNELVTTRRISDAEAIINNNGFLTPFPGSSIPALDIQEIVYGETTTYTPYSATNFLWFKLQQDSYGTGHPTASDRLHITIIAQPAFAGESASMVIPSCNFLIGAVTAHEDDLVYIERLRRAYTQQRSEP